MVITRVTVALTVLDNSHDASEDLNQLLGIRVSTTLPTQLKRLTNQPASEPCKNRDRDSSHPRRLLSLSFPLLQILRRH